VLHAPDVCWLLHVLTVVMIMSKTVHKLCLIPEIPIVHCTNLISETPGDWKPLLSIGEMF